MSSRVMSSCYVFVHRVTVKLCNYILQCIVIKFPRCQLGPGVVTFLGEETPVHAMVRAIPVLVFIPFVRMLIPSVRMLTPSVRMLTPPVHLLTSLV